MGASCFTHRVRITPVPKGFKLHHDQQKYDGSQEPHSWLSDYLQAVKLLGGNQGNSNAKFAITPHRRSKVMVKQIREKQLEAGRSSQSNLRATSSRHTSGQHP
jgi:hypothetical protein